MSDPSTDRHKRNIGNLWVPIGSVVVMTGFIGTAAVTWATDRAELKATSAAVSAQAVSIDQLKQESAKREERDANLKETLVRMQGQLDRIADRVGAKP